jgi:hypothetical protein
LPHWQKFLKYRPELFPCGGGSGFFMEPGDAVASEESHVEEGGFAAWREFFL